MRLRLRAGRKKYLDVWPVDFLSSEETNVADNTSLFMMQLACIVNSVAKWRSHKVRVFMCVKEAEVNIKSKELELKKLLEMLRIQAETHVLVWDQEMFLEENDLGLKSEFRGNNFNTIFSDKTVSTASEQYLLSVNEFIRVQCVETAVSFIYLSKPPTDHTKHQSYLWMLEMITRNLPPTILVHGVSPVITTTL